MADARRRAWLKLACALLVVATSMGIAPDEQAILFRGGHLFDGSGAPARVADVLVRRGVIARIGARLAAPRAARIIPAQGMTLLPGLHDLHTHLRAPATGDDPEDMGKAWAGHLLAGVTSVNDYALSGAMIAPVRALAKSGENAPRLNIAVRIGVPGGHGTAPDGGGPYSLIVSNPAEAAAAARTALGYRPDLIKVFADGWRYGRSRDLADMDLATLSAIVAVAKRAGVPVVTHTVTLKGAKIAALAGVTAVVHGVGDAPVDDALIRLMKRSGTAYVPTMAVYEPQATRTLSSGEVALLSPAEKAADARIRAMLAGTVPDYEARRWAFLRANLRRLHAAGIRIGIGSDAGIAGVYHGSSALRELSLFVNAGLSPRAALRAATADAARIIGKDERLGRIRPGYAADIILVRRRPDLNIADIFAHKRVFVGGREVDLPSLRAMRDAPAPSPVYPLSPRLP